VRDRRLLHRARPRLRHDVPLAPAQRHDGQGTSLSRGRGQAGSSPLRTAVCVISVPPDLYHRMCRRDRTCCYPLFRIRVPTSWRPPRPELTRLLRTSRRRSALGGGRVRSTARPSRLASPSHGRNPCRPGTVPSFPCETVACTRAVGRGVGSTRRRGWNSLPLSPHGGCRPVDADPRGAAGSALPSGRGLARVFSGCCAPPTCSPAPGLLRRACRTTSATGRPARLGRDRDVPA